jgi:hypothetical protein
VYVDPAVAKLLLVKIEQLRSVITRGFGDVIEIQNCLQNQMDVVMKALACNPVNVVDENVQLPLDSLESLQHFNSLLDKQETYTNLVINLYQHSIMREQL